MNASKSSSSCYSKSSNGDEYLIRLSTTGYNYQQLDAHLLIVSVTCLRWEVKPSISVQEFQRLEL